MTTTEPTTEPTTQPTAPAGGWNWVTRYRDLPPATQITKLLDAWDGLFTADCPCGREVEWDAFTFQPICTCPPMSIELEEESA